MTYRPNSQSGDILYCIVQQRSLPCPVPYRHTITPASTSFVKFPFSCLLLCKNVNNTGRIRLVSTMIFYRKNRQITETLQRTVARSVLTRKRFPADMGFSSWKTHVWQILGPQSWARVHCTRCTPYCYATG